MGCFRCSLAMAFSVVIWVSSGLYSSSTWASHSWWDLWGSSPSTNSCIGSETESLNWQWQAGQSQLTLNGSAIDNGSTLILTQSLNEAGSAFWKTPFNLYSNAANARSFSAAFSFRISNPDGISDSDGQGGDGLTFVINQSDQGLGKKGGGLGYEGLYNSVAVEFDTYNNGWRDRNNGNHIGIDTSGRVRSKHMRRVEQRLNDGNIWYAWIDYRGDKRKLEVRLAQTADRPDRPFMTKRIGIPWRIGGSEAYVGFTSGTGEAASVHEILSFDFVSAYASVEECDPPEFISGPVKSVVANTLYSYQAQASDATVGDTLSYSLINAPETMTIDSASGLISWLPDDQNVGEHIVELQVEDTTGLQDRQSYTLTVVENLTCGVEGTHTVRFNNFEDVSDWQLNGEAVALNPNGYQVLSLTDNLSQSGSAFLTEAIPLTDANGFNASFSASFGFKLSNASGISDLDGQGADGLMFVVQTMASNVGGNGGGIGYEGIERSVGIEFDTWNNGAVDNHNGNHVGINTNGNMDSLVIKTLEQRFNDGQQWYAWIDYDGNQQRLEISIANENARPAEPTLIHHGIDLATILQYENAYIGFTSGTGAAGGHHDVFNFEFTNTIAPIGDCGELAISSTPPTEITSGDTLNYQTEVTGAAANAILSYNILSGPATSTIDSTGLLQWVSSGTSDVVFTLQVETDDGESAEQTFSVSVIPLSNQAPIAVNQNATGNEDTSLAIILSATDIDGDVLTYTVIQQPANGSISGVTPNLAYIPDSNFNGVDSFTFTANDGALDSNTATVSIAVSAINDNPVAQAQSVNSPEDTGVTGQLVGTDVDGDALTHRLQQNASNGIVVVQASGVFSYTPDANFNGSDSFTFVVNDGTVDSSAAVVNITVSATNDQPVATAQSVTVNEDSSVAVTLTGNDIDDDILTYQIAMQPANGSLTGTSPNLTYQPNADFNGTDSFTFRVNDGTTDSTDTTVSITIAATNDTPIADPQSVIADEDTNHAFTLTASDVDGDSLTYQIIALPTNGVLAGVAPNITYQPNQNYNGTDNFTFRVNDGSEDSIDATVTITVNAANDLPVADAINLNTDEDTAATVTLTGSDIDGESLTYQVVSQPTNGALSGSAPNLTYQPNAEFNGADSFTFRVNDGFADSTDAMVQITVAAINDSPVADGQSITADEDSNAVITITGSDIDGDVLTYQIVTQPTNGALTGTVPNITYLPNQNYNGTDSFIFRVNDGAADSVDATVQITVTAANDLPVADSQAVTTNEDTSAVITLSGSDIDGDALTYQVVLHPTQGVLTGSAPNLIYQPNADYSGADSFTFRTNDGTGDSIDAIVNITVAPENDSPVAEDLTAITNEDTTVAITLAGSDIDGDSLTYQIIAQPTNGTLTGTAPNLTYQPNTNFNGTDSFTYQANDGNADSTDAMVKITVTAVNDLPVADTQVVSTNEDTSVVITLSGSDIDDDALTYQVIILPTQGVLTGSAPNLTYQPNANFNGEDSFTFRVNDGTSDSPEVTIDITVNTVNDSPTLSIISPQSGDVFTSGETISFSANAIDIEDGNIAANVSWVVNPGAINLGVGDTVNATFAAGDFSVAATIVDSGNVSVSQNIVISIIDTNKIPVVTSIPVTTTKVNASYSYAINVIDEDANDVFNFGILSAPTGMTIDASTGVISWGPQQSDLGTHFVSVQIDDGQGGVITHDYSLIVVEETIDDAAHLGTDFWIPRLPAVFNNRLYITSTTDTTGVVDVLGGVGAGQTPFSVKANQITMVEVSPVRATQIHQPDTAANGVRNWAVNVTSEAPISISVIYYRPAQTEGLLAFPAKSFGKEYFLTSMGELGVQNQGPRSTIIATQDNTIVTVTPTTPLEVDGVMIQPGQTGQFMINRGEDYHLRSTRDDLSGTSIVADKPVAVFSGFGCAYVPTSTYSWCNRLSEQMLPVNLWQKRFITTPLKTRVGDFFRVFASVDNTEVMVNGVVNSVINRGEFTSFPLIEASEITASEPVQIIQHSTSLAYDLTLRQNDPLSDVQNEILNQTASWSSNYHVELDPAPAENYIFVVIPDEVKSSLQLDGNPVDIRAFGRPVEFNFPFGITRPDRLHTTVQIALTAGVHNVSASEPFGVYKNINAVNRYADPAMAVLQPEQSYLNAYSFQTPDTGGMSRNFINITILQDQISNVVLDGQSIDPAHFTSIANTEFAFARLGVNIGPHYIYADKPFGLLVYGYDEADAYMHPGGWAFNQSQSVNLLTLQADNTTPTVTDNICLTATAFDASNNSVAFANIDLVVSGLHNSQASLTANQSGVANYCYQGVYVGTDLIEASSANGQATLNVNWSLGAVNHAPIIISKPVLLIQDTETYNYAVKAVDADNNPLTYSLVNPPAGMNIDSATGVISWIAVAGQYPIEVVVTDSPGSSTDQQYTLIVNRTPNLVETPRASLVSQQSYNSRIVVNDPDGDTLYYRLTEGGDQFSINSLTGEIYSTDALSIGPYPITIEVSDHKGGFLILSYNLVVDGINLAPTLTTPITSFSVVAGEEVTFDFTASDANGDEVVFNVISGQLPGLVINSSTGHTVWNSDNSVVGNHLITVVATDVWGATSAPVVLDFSISENLPPQIISIPPAIARVGELYEYPVVVDDPENRPVTLAFVNVSSGMGGLAISSDHVITWTPGTTALGKQFFIQFRATDDLGQTHDQSFFFDVRNVNTSPPNLIGTLPGRAFVGDLLSFQIQAEDPDNDPIEFSRIDGPDGLTISSTGLIEWTPQTNQVGDQSVTMRMSDGELFREITWTISTLLTPLPLEANIVVDPMIINSGETTLLTVQAFGGINPSIDNVTVDGVVVPLVNQQATLTSDVIGRHDIVVTLSDQGVSSDFTSFFTVTDPNDTSFPTVTIESPLAGEQITTLTPVVVSVDDDNLVDVELFVRKRGATESTELYRGSVSISSQTIAEFDPTLLRNGLYELVLRATDVNGLIQQTMNPVVVEGGKKIGNFAITLQDLNIPLAGIPITVSRTYDSRRKNEKLDFGYGWSIDYQNVTVEEASEPSTGWNRTQEAQVFKINGQPINFQGTCMRPSENKTVTVTLPNDDIEVFTVRLRGVTGSQIADSDPNCDLTPSTNYDLFFDPDEDTDSTLESYTDSNLFFNGAGNLVDDIVDETPTSVTKYRLTTRFGFIYNLDEDFGVESVIDPNGNSLTYSDTGIVHSSGKSVSFVRNAEGLITSITDPNSNVIGYQYNSNTDLVSSSDVLNNNTSYRYDYEHGLVDIEDPLGRNLIKNIYDADGRLIAQEDSDGNRTTFSHDLTSDQSIVTDRLGRVQVFNYNDRGNVTSEIDALGNVTSYTFDANDNQLSKTDGLGRVSNATYNENDDQLTQTDALGNVVSFTYNDLGQELTVTDESGDMFNNAYDVAGNLLSITDPQNNIASNTINIQGLPATVQDALGNTTSFTYDGDGRKLTETNALGDTTTFTVDANSNVLSESISRTLADSSIVTETTSFEYDAMDRVIKTTDTLGNISEVEFNAVGQQSATIDALGRRTEMDYDVYGRLIETRYPDGTVQTSTYDAEGNLLTETDRLGRVTSFEYDALNRLIKTTLPDNSFTQTEYDAIGQVVAEIDANGNRSTHEYDAAGRRIKTTDALNNVHQFSYDADGNLISETDAQNRTTTYVYDSLDRKIQTIFFDNSTMQDGYDALARKTSATDQAGIVTDYGYDALGRLTSVTDALGQVTAYTYDEVGNKLTQTDAEGRTTSWTYDALGRVLTRTLPLGQVESLSYDAVGNLLSKTDFNGDITSYDYDSNDRLTLVNYVDGSNESNSYDAEGNRLTATNGQGTWTYTYDELNRLSSETKPTAEVLEYQYDSNGNKTELKITYANATVRTESFTYDLLNRLETVTDNDGNITSYGYDAVGNRTSVSYQNGSSQIYSYDSLNRLTSLSHFDGNGALINQYDYTLHATGRRTEITESIGRTSTYSYDDLYRLTIEAIVDPINGDHDAAYQYDQVGNRIESIINGVTTAYTYDDNDRLTQQGGETFTYDDMGNTLSKTIDADITSYGYNAQQELISADITEAGVNTTTSYLYNPDGIRVQAIEDGTSVSYLVDNNTDYAQVVAETDLTGSVSVEYTFGDDLISQTRGLEVASYLYDGLGSTRGLTDSVGTATDHYYYDAFGNTLAVDGLTENDYLFTGEQFDSALGNYYLRARYYDPGVGRFTQMDTWKGNRSDPVTLHKYLYANVDPVNNIDPSGKFSLGSVSKATSIANTLSGIAINIYEVFQFATGDGEVSASQIGAGIILGMLPGSSGIKMLKMSNLGRKINGNSKKSRKPQHVYKIDDKLEFDIYKFGISGGALNKNGSSRRANTQANKLNRPFTFKRYVPKVIYKKVPGRIAALAIEKSLVCAYNKSKGRNPVGNKRPLCH